MAQLGARFNRTEEVAGSNPARSILAVIFRGPWRSWERVSMALRRSRVRVPLGPLIDLYLYGKCTRGNKKGRRRAVFFVRCSVSSTVLPIPSATLPTRYRSSLDGPASGGYRRRCPGSLFDITKNG